MRIANYYDDIRRVGRNDGAPMYVTHVLREMGHEVAHLIPDARRLKDAGKFDLHLWIDWGADALKGILDYDPVLDYPSPRVCWLSDTHLGYDARLDVARHFQGEGSHVFCMQKRASEEFRNDGIVNPGAVWLPHAFEPLAYPKIPIIKKYDVCFVGHLNSRNRIDFLDRMFREFPNFWFGQRLFEDAAKIFCQSKIVLNPPIKDDLPNMRVFEALGTGSFLLTLDTGNIRDLFEDGKHLVLYKTVEEAIEKAKYYIEHDEERERIAAEGMKEVHAKHTYRHRVETILEAVKSQNVKEKEPCLLP